MGYHLINYIDDLASCVPDTVAPAAYAGLRSLLNNLGIQEAPEKSCPPTKVMEFLGVTFNVTDMTMSVTPERVTEIICLLDRWLNKKKATKKQLQSLIGKLQFAAKCVRAGRIFISRLLLILPTLRKQHHRFYVNSQFRKDLLWWRSFLVTFNGVSIIPHIAWTGPDTTISTDACLKSLGGWSGSSFFSCMFPRDILKQELHISALELYAIIIALKLWADRCANTRIQVFCDNSASVSVINTGRTKDKVMLALLREMAFICASHNCQVRAEHIPGVDNRLSDLFSRAPIEASSHSKLLGLLRNETWNRIQVRDDLFHFNNEW
jgi:hypothetical protein